MRPRSSSPTRCTAPGTNPHGLGLTPAAWGDSRASPARTSPLARQRGARTTGSCSAAGLAPTHEPSSPARRPGQGPEQPLPHSRRCIRYRSSCARPGSRPSRERVVPESRGHRPVQHGPDVMSPPTRPQFPHDSPAAGAPTQGLVGLGGHGRKASDTEPTRHDQQ